ncbi:MAG: hypothetical protein VW835_09785 [Rickettsiales bacterium]
MKRRFRVDTAQAEASVAGRIGRPARSNTLRCFETAGSDIS